MRVDAVAEAPAIGPMGVSQNGAARSMRHILSFRSAMLFQEGEQYAHLSQLAGPMQSVPLAELSAFLDALRKLDRHELHQAEIHFVTDSKKTHDTLTCVCVCV